MNLNDGRAGDGSGREKEIGANPGDGGDFEKELAEGNPESCC